MNHEFPYQVIVKRVYPVYPTFAVYHLGDGPMMTDSLLPIYFLTGYVMNSESNRTPPVVVSAASSMRVDKAAMTVNFDSLYVNEFPMS
jgi:hypothetical protein